ncbi:Riboflavin biosynthesis protein RibF [Marinomonas gallaica]|uniref:Riboflavin biosynthesis protein n=1 Tax=Marinomonas gallaica TaxID=1806667 RepID=A0A1C3JT63_9GAMM|nr:bifunctional riboflavin kinase/FAD synthetase [Marinomonas gallaica]SBT18418.1 Riboflavin biosynthesis protein RibF [Marinomonas gallaica]SBT19830.1 Riboflavin biosynthesis protein RibF [Marinomonas gallaica]
MELVRGIHNLQDAQRNGVLTIGNFDGVHLGHQAILNRVKSLAEHYRAPSGIMIFEPQPREFFAPQDAPGRLSRLRDKVALLSKHDIDYVLCMPFNTRLRTLDAHAFCQQILHDGLAVKHLVVGDDFRFGCDRQGNFEYLEAFGAQHGFDVENTSSILNGEGLRISSSLVRQQLNQGDMVSAQAMLGHPITMRGRVVGGQQLARRLGFPTANIFLKGVTPALFGVYAVTVPVDGKEYSGVANIGVRPTVDGKTPILEVHLFNFSGDVYTQYLEVTFRQFIRPERKMNGLDELEKQIQCDKEEALRFFSNQ